MQIKFLGQAWVYMWEQKKKKKQLYCAVVLRVGSIGWINSHKGYITAARKHKSVIIFTEYSLVPKNSKSQQEHSNIFNH